MVLLWQLFNLAIIIVMVGLWGLFIKNLLNEVRKGKKRAEDNQWRQASVKKQTQQPSNRQMRNQQLQRARNVQSTRNRNEQQQSSRRNTTSIRLKELLKYKPADLYGLLKESLPDQYKQEIQAVFNSPNSEVELIKFIRRPDVWPTVKKTLSEIASGRHEKSSMMADYKITNEAPILSETEEDELDWQSLDQESDVFQEEYNQYAKEFDIIVDKMLQTSEGLAVEPSLNRKTHSSHSQKDQQRQKEWLREAVIAQTILERPDF